MYSYGVQQDKLPSLCLHWTNMMPPARGMAKPHSPENVLESSRPVGTEHGGSLGVVALCYDISHIIGLDMCRELQKSTVQQLVLFPSLPGFPQPAGPHRLRWACHGDVCAAGHALHQVVCGKGAKKGDMPVVPPLP